MDRPAFNSLKKIQAEVGNSWVDGTQEVLKRHNPELLRKIDSLETQLNSLIAIDGKSKTKELKAKTKESLKEYKRLCLCAVMFATRYLDKVPVTR